MRILAITRSPWKNDNNIGNTLTNIFSSIPNAELHNIYFREHTTGYYENLKSIFCISEKSIIKNVFSKNNVGEECNNDMYKIDNSFVSEQRIYNFAKKNTFSVFKYVRELIWGINNWKNANLKKYILEISPDIVFMPVFDCWYPYRVLSYIKSFSNAKIVLFHADDNYTWHYFSFSPFNWIYRLILRGYVRNCVDSSDLNYVISEKQKNEYDKIFKKDMRILVKTYSFEEKIQTLPFTHSKLSIVYTGNLSSERWKSIYKLGRVVKKLGYQNNVLIDVYSSSTLTKKMKKCLSESYCINFKGCVPNSEVYSIQRESDILLHAESFSLKSRKEVRLSFSTKLVDYFHQAKCIFAVGPKEVASMDYLIKNDAAITATSEKEIEEKLKLILENPDIIKEYGDKAWECGKRNHQIDKIQKMLKEDFEKLIESK